MIRTTAVLPALLVSVAAVPAGAQPLAARGYVTYGATTFAAGDTFEAVAGSATEAGWGGGGTVAGLWRGLFVDVGVAQQTVEGERVFVHGDAVFPLGIPLTVRLRPIDVAAGWRFAHGRVSPYVGGGITRVAYRETGGFALIGEDVNDRRSGALALGGVDVALARWLHVGGEVRYRAVSGVLGVAGASQAFDEDQLGGVSTALRLSVGL